MKIGIVSQERALPNILEIYLEQAGHVVHWCDNARCAVENLEQMGGVDLLIADVMLHGATGVELLDWLRSDSLFGEVPFIFITAVNQTSEISKRLRTYKDVSYFQKPIDIDEVLDAIAGYDHDHNDNSEPAFGKKQ